MSQGFGFAGRGLAALMITGGFGFSAIAQTTAPATPPAAATQPAARDPQAIMADYQRIGQKIEQLVTDHPATRPADLKALAPQLTPLFRELMGYAQELEQSDDPSAKMIGDAYRWMLLGELASLGDVKAVAELERLAQGADAEQAVRAKMLLLAVRWQNAETTAEQLDLVDQAAAAAEAHPDSDAVGQVLMQIVQSDPAPEVVQRIGEVAKNLQGPSAMMIAEMASAYQRRHALLNQPLVLSGVTPGGETFSSESLKGKVVLVDFWATWCGPCIAEIPEMVETYEKYRDQGFEILGVSSDRQPAALDRFLAQRPEVAWPQLFNREKPGQHELAERLGIVSYPTMFLIDKQGIVRSINARADYQEQIPKLLAE